MRDMPSDSNSPVMTHLGWHRFQQQLRAGRLGLAIPFVLAVFLGHETYRQIQPTEFTSVEIEQAWELEPGDRLGNYLVSSGLGDIVIELGGSPLYMPMTGEVQPISLDCSLFSSAELPAYRLRLCGLNQIQSGSLNQGAVLGRGDRVALALLRRQPQGTWAMVEPATSILEQFLTPPQP